MSISSTMNSVQARQPLRFTVPQELHEIDLTEDPEVRMRRAYANATAVMRGSTEEQRVYLVYTQETMVAQLQAQGAVYSGQLLARSDVDPARPATAQFSVLVKQADLDARAPLAAVADGLREPGREVGFAQYPAGEALVIGEELKVTLPTTVTGALVPNEHIVRQAQIIFACPDDRHLAMFTMSSESLMDWRTYIDILDGMARSVSFREPGKRSIADRMSGF
jgi:hypothetical protein